MCVYCSLIKMKKNIKKMDIVKFQKSRATVLEMLKDRKYVIEYPDKEKIDPAINQLQMIMNFKDSLIIGNNGKEKVYVYFIFEKIGVKTANTIIETLEKDKVNHIILVCKDGFTTFAEQSIKKNNLEIELFLQDQLLYNIMKNEYQPLSIDHIKDKETIKLLHQTFSIKKKQNLMILNSDPVNKYYNGKPGEMYKIITRGGRLDYYMVI